MNNLKLPVKMKTLEQIKQKQQAKEDRRAKIIATIVFVLLIFITIGMILSK